jgi:phosphotriesterase-related protein
MGLGREIGFIKSVSEGSGLNVIAATGIYTFDALPALFASRSVDHLADAFVHDIEVGIQGTSIRAGFLKCATDLPGVTSHVEMVLRAVARAHRRTGMPIMTHAHAASGAGLEQQDVFEDEGVDLGRVLIGHCGDTTDMGYLEKVAERGSFLGMDRYGLVDFLPTEERNAAVVRMCELGFVGRLMLSQDYACVSDMLDKPEIKAARKDWSLTYVVDSVLPELRRLGVQDDRLTQMMVANPRQWLAPCSPY